MQSQIDLRRRKTAAIKQYVHVATHSCHSLSQTPDRLRLFAHRKCASITAQLATLQAQTLKAANSSASSSNPARPAAASSSVSDKSQRHPRLEDSSLSSAADAAATAAQEALDIFAKLRARAADAVV